MHPDYLLGKDLMEQQGWTVEILEGLVSDGLRAYQGINRLRVVDINKLERLPHFTDDAEASRWLNLYWNMDRTKIEGDDNRKIKDIFDTCMSSGPLGYEEAFYSHDYLGGQYPAAVLKPLMEYESRKAPEGCVAVDFNEKQPVQDWYFKRDDITGVVAYGPEFVAPPQSKMNIFVNIQNAQLNSYAATQVNNFCDLSPLAETADKLHRAISKTEHVSEKQLETIEGLRETANALKTTTETHSDTLSRLTEIGNQFDKHAALLERVTPEDDHVAKLVESLRAMYEKMDEQKQIVLITKYLDENLLERLTNGALGRYLTTEGCKLEKGSYAKKGARARMAVAEMEEKKFA